MQRGVDGSAVLGLLIGTGEFGVCGCLECVDYDVEITGFCTSAGELGCVSFDVDCVDVGVVDVLGIVKICSRDCAGFPGEGGGKGECKGGLTRRRSLSVMDASQLVGEILVCSGIPHHCYAFHRWALGEISL